MENLTLVEYRDKKHREQTASNLPSTLVLMGGRSLTGRDSKKTNIAKGYKGWEVVESYDHQGARYIKEKETNGL